VAVNVAALAVAASSKRKIILNRADNFFMMLPFGYLNTL
jgi:hypothetical protein